MYQLAFFKKIYFWILLWVIFFIFYGISIKYNFCLNKWQKLIWFVQLWMDILIGYFSISAFRNKSLVDEKKFYYLVFLSVIPGLLTNEIYNALFNWTLTNNIKIETDLYWDVSYFLFLIIQFFSWSYLLLKYSHFSDHTNKVIVVIYIQPIIIIFLSVMTVSVFGDVFYRMDFIGILNSIFESILFILISICLSRSKNSAIVRLEVGFLLLIAFNIIHRFSYVTDHYTKLFDIGWMLCLILIIFGFAESKKNDERIEFHLAGSIHIIVNGIFVSMSTFLFIFFVVVGFAISSVEIGKVGGSEVLPQNIPGILIFSYVLTLLISRFVANFIAQPLNHLRQKINLICASKYQSYIIDDVKVNINEIIELEKFALDTIQKLQIANRVKSDFLMNMSHDFRTPASGIYQMSKYVHKNLHETNLASYMNLIVESSGQLINLLDDVLDYSRMDSDKWMLNFENFDLNTVVGDVLICLSAKSKEKNLRLTGILTPEPLNYFGDKLAINRIILNLVSNAIKFTNEGFVRVITTNKEKYNKSWIVVEIKDTGIGISPQYHKKIFEPFTRISPAENSKYSGIGLGLSNANLIVKKMGGKITVDSVLSEGSIFSLYLPIVQSSEKNT